MAFFYDSDNDRTTNNMERIFSKPGVQQVNVLEVKVLIAICPSDSISRTQVL